MIYKIKSDSGLYVRRTDPAYVPHEFRKRYILTANKQYATKFRTEQKALDFAKSIRLKEYIMAVFEELKETIKIDNEQAK